MQGPRRPINFPLPSPVQENRQDVCMVQVATITVRTGTKSYWPWRSCQLARCQRLRAFRHLLPHRSSPAMHWLTEMCVFVTIQGNSNPNMSRHSSPVAAPQTPATAATTDILIFHQSQPSSPSPRRCFSSPEEASLRLIFIGSELLAYKPPGRT